MERVSFAAPWQLASRGLVPKSVLGGRIKEKADKRLAEIESHGGKGYFVPVDVTSRQSLHDMLETILEKSGGVDILINGAGTNSPTPFLEISEDEYARIIDTNLTAIFRACQVFGQYFVDEMRPASIINLGSISGLNPLSRVFTYSASKAAVHNLSRNLAREWADKDIRVNTLVPGFFPAEQNRKVLDESRVLDILRQTPASRFGNADGAHRSDPASSLTESWLLHHRHGNDRRWRVPGNESLDLGFART